MNKFAIALLTGLFWLSPAVSAQVDENTEVCAPCHGEDGNSLAPTFPKLAGQNPRYLLKQMQDIKSGLRAVPTMIGQLDDLSDQDLIDISAYYASQTGSKGATSEALAAFGESIYRAGLKDKGVAACTACHSPRGDGNGPAGFPMLSGQHAEYTGTTLRAFRNGERSNDGDSRIMRDIADRLSDREINAVASYIAGLR